MNALIVGGDSGIGNAILQRIPEAVYTSRKLGCEYRLDVTDTSTYPTFNSKFDVIYYCVGVSNRNNTIEEVINVNAIKSIQVLRHLTSFVKDNGSIRILSSIGGSIGHSVALVTDRIDVGYKMSKAALNIGVVKLHKEFPSINWQLLHPGLVRTRMTAGLVTIGTNLCPISPEESADKILNTPIKPGLSFVNVVTGEDIPW